MVKGKGQYLVPELEMSPDCQRSVTKHGANRMQTWQMCTTCGQKQEMPLTPLTELHKWNDTLIYVPDPFYDKLKKKKNKMSGKEEESVSSASQIPSPSTTTPVATGARPKFKAAPALLQQAQRMTAAKTPPMKKEMKSEVKDEVEEVAPTRRRRPYTEDSWCDVVANDILEQAQTVYIGDETMDMEGVIGPAHSQPCQDCGQGEVVLHRHLPDMKLFWKCDNQRCQMAQHPEMNGQTQVAYGVQLCPRCHRNELLQINDAQNPEDIELQCTHDPCSLQIYFFELDHAYEQMGRMFNVRRI